MIMVNMAGTTNYGAMTWESTAVLRAYITGLQPDNHTLIRWAAVNPPPQSRWDEDDDPTEVEDGDG